ncbi:MAG: polysaccharide deacetylase family protein [Saprospiraceae bacterium]|nr:polysaccharide deacetylase family protein [Saprospiraceae bacterium]
MYLVKPPYLIKLLTKCLFTWQIKTSEKIIYLTFDDGPTNELTPWILETLNKYKAKATFFVVGQNTKDSPNLIKSIVDSGHSLGNHTFNHLNGKKTLNSEYYSNIEKTNEVVKSKLFRPPYGRIKIPQAKHLRKKFQIIMWSVLSGDFDRKITKEKCLRNAINNTKKGSIIVFHDNIKAKENIQFTLPAYLKHYSDLGFRFDGL